MRAHGRIAPLIVFALQSVDMAVDLDDESGLLAEEISDG